MNLSDIEDEIQRLERGETSFSNCERLAVMYAVRDGLTPKVEDEYSYRHSFASTEFGLAFEQAPQDVAIKVLEEHMDAVRLLYPKEYSLILDRLKGY